MHVCLLISVSRDVFHWLSWSRFYILPRLIYPTLPHEPIFTCYTFTLELVCHSHAHIHIHTHTCTHTHIPTHTASALPIHSCSPSPPPSQDSRMGMVQVVTSDWVTNAEPPPSCVWQRRWPGTPTPDLLLFFIVLLRSSAIRLGSFFFLS